MNRPSSEEKAAIQRLFYGFVSKGDEGAYWGWIELTYGPLDDASRGEFRQAWVAAIRAKQEAGRQRAVARIVRPASKSRGER